MGVCTWSLVSLITRLSWLLYFVDVSNAFSQRAKGVHFMCLAPKGLMVDYIAELSQEFRSELLTW